LDTQQYLRVMVMQIGYLTLRTQNPLVYIFSHLIE
jgi:hypothetical protein